MLAVLLFSNRGTGVAGSKSVGTHTAANRCQEAWLLPESLNWVIALLRKKLSLTLGCNRLKSKALGEQA